MKIYQTTGKLFFLLFVTGIFFGCNQKNGSENPEAVVKTETVKAKSVVFYTKVKGYGTIEAENSLDLEAKFDGIISFKKLYGKIKKGEIIYTLGGSEIALKKETLQKALANANSQYDYTKQYYDAQQKLHNDNYLAHIEFEKISSDLKNAQISVNVAQYELDYFKSMVNYKAPFDGYLDDMRVPQGEDAVAGQVLATFQDDNKLKLTAPFYGNLSSLKSNKINLVINGKNYSGILIYKGQVLDSSTGGHTLWISINNPEGLKSGDYVSYAFLLNKRTATAVPDDAVIEQKGRYFVVVPEKKQYKKVKINIGVEQNGLVEIRSGLKPGTKVMTKGAFEIFYGNIEETMKIED